MQSRMNFALFPSFAASSISFLSRAETRMIKRLVFFSNSSKSIPPGIPGSPAR